MENKMKLKEVVVIAMLSAILGAVFTVMDGIYQPLQNLLGPLGGDVISGIYLLSAMLPIFIIRKPGAALLGSLFTGVMNLLLGSPYGIHIIVAAILQGIGLEIVMAIFKYKKYSFVSIGIGGVMATIFLLIRDYYVFGFGLYANLVVYMIIIRIASAFIVGSGLTILIGKGLKATGVLKGFKISKES